MVNITDLDIRIEKIERMLKKYASPIEPKSWEFDGQEWFNTATEVLHKWNGRGYVPAYGKSIVSDIQWFQTAIEQNTSDIALKVSSNEVISSINLSPEWVRIVWSRIRIDGLVEFASWYSPDDIIQDIEWSLWSLAYEDAVQYAMLWTTVVQGGFIKTELINATQIFAQDINATGTITGLTLRSPDYTPLGTGWWVIDNSWITVRWPEEILQEVEIRQWVIDVQNMTNQWRTRLIPGSITLRTTTWVTRSIVVNSDYMSIPNLETNRLYLWANNDYYLSRFWNTIEWFDGNFNNTIMVYTWVSLTNPWTPTHRIRFNHYGVEYWIPAIAI